MKPLLKLITPEEGKQAIRALLREHREAVGGFCFPDDLPPPQPAVEVDIGKAMVAMEKASKEGLGYRIDLESYMTPPEAWVIISITWPGVQKLVLPFRVSRNREFLTLLAQSRRLWLQQWGETEGRQAKATVLEEIPVGLISFVLALTSLLPRGVVAGG